MEIENWVIGVAVPCDCPLLLLLFLAGFVKSPNLLYWLQINKKKTDVWSDLEPSYSTVFFFLLHCKIL